MSAKKYKCPYCQLRLERKELINHIDEEHEDMLPKGYSAARLVYNQINKRTHGTCMICKKETEWDENKQRYDTLCGSKKCHDEYVKMVRTRMVRKYGTETLLNNPEHQKKMLANRSISGYYKFRDGGKIGYVGSYENKFLEFLDVFLNVKSSDIISPGPTILYHYKGKEHFWVTDFLYEPYNLVFDIKDGGSNPNTREMKEYREKQKAKELSIQEQGDYNYIRLTDNKFEQLIEIFLLLKDSEYLSRPLIKINELANIHEEYRDNDLTRQQIYHISTVNHDGEIFEPRVYDNDNVKKGMERRVKRICFSDSIEGAYYSIFPNGTYDIDLYVHIPATDVKIYRTTTDDIYDSDITHEIWVKEPVEMRCIGKVHISGTTQKYKTIDVDSEKSGYGKRKYFKPRYNWVEKYDAEVVEEACKDLNTARKFVRDVGKLAKKYNANYFIVTDGASGTSNNGNPAVRHARQCQIEWEKQHGFDPDEDWSNESALLESTVTKKQMEDMNTVIKSLGKDDYNDFTDSKKYNYVKIHYDNSRPVGFCATRNVRERLNGTVNKVCMISIAVSPEYRRKGIASSLARNVISHAKKDKDLFRIYWGLSINNTASEELAKKLGFKFDYESKEHDIKVYYIPLTKETITEGFIFNKKDLYINYESFESGKSNVLLVTGLSGSGKTTLASKIAKENNAELIELDCFECCYQFTTDEQLKQAGQVFYDYLSSHKQLWDNLKERKIKGKELATEIDKFIKYCIPYCKRDKGTKYVIEGVQIYSFLEKQSLGNTPIIMTGASALTSIARRLKRAKNNNMQDLKNQLSELPQCIAWYVDEENAYKKFVKVITES